MRNERRDEIVLAGVARAVEDRGVHLVSAGDHASLAATAVLGKALKRAGVDLAGLTVASSAARVDDPEARPAMRRAGGLIVVGAGLGDRPLVDDMPQLSIDATEGEPLAERALRLAESLTHDGDALWVAALGLVRSGTPHAIVERALARHTREDLLRVTDLLEAAARSPMPGMMSVIALELLIAAPDPRRFLSAEPCDLLRRCQAIVTVELAKATRLRPRAGRGVVVVEYDSACHLEDMVAARWRGLRPGTAIVAANHSWIEGRVALVARSAAPESLDRLTAFLRAPGSDASVVSTGRESLEAVMSPASWQRLCATLGVPATQPIAAAERHELDVDIEAALSTSHAPMVN
jgi:hypothetical protein